MDDAVQAAERHAEVARTVEEHAFRYYVLSQPTASDGEYDALVRELEVLEAEHPEAAAVVKLRYFAGMTAEQAADALDLSRRTADRHWAFARAWLFDALGGAAGV